MATRGRKAMTDEEKQAKQEERKKNFATVSTTIKKTQKERIAELAEDAGMTTRSMASQCMNDGINLQYLLKDVADYLEGDADPYFGNKVASHDDCLFFVSRAVKDLIAKKVKKEIEEEE